MQKGVCPNMDVRLSPFEVGYATIASVELVRMQVTVGTPQPQQLTQLAINACIR